MKKIVSGLISTALLVMPVIALAQDAAHGIPAPDWGEVDVMEVLENLTNWMFVILLIVAAIFIIVAAFYFVTAQGDPDKTNKARNFVLYALIGVLIAFVAKGLIYLVDQIVRG